MTNIERLRWALLSTALLGTITASVYTPEVEGDFVAPSSPRPAAKLPAAAAKAAAAAQPEWIATDENPFLPRLWQAPPTTPETSRAVEAIAVAEAPAAPPPPLPYAFVGQMSDDGKRVIYLSRGEQLLVARDGEVLDGTYKVASIGAASIEFETVASGLRQTLPIPAQERQ